MGDRFRRGKSARTKASQQAWPPIYDDIPEFDFSLTEIVELAFHRSELHQEIEACIETDGNVSERLLEYGLKPEKISAERSRAKLPAVSHDLNADERDVFGFFSLLLVSLRSKEATIQFLKNEKIIFATRLGAISGLKLTGINPKLMEEGYDLTSYVQGNTMGIPFEHIFPDIDVTRAELENGFVKIALEDLRPLFANRFQKLLSKKVLELEANNANKTEAFDAIVELFNAKQEVGLLKERKNWSAVSADDLDTVSHRSFPPCMYNMYKTLKERHKLYHMGRLQLGLFLKKIGLSLNDSLQVWRNELSKVVGIDGFEKQYAYNIRYNYGKEGAGKNREPYSCVGMIMRCPPPAADQVHGCPLRTMELEDTKRLLREMARFSPRMKNMQPESVNSEITKFAIQGKEHPQIACAKIYEAFHGTEYDGPGVMHPCEYFTQSEDELKAKASQ